MPFKSYHVVDGLMIGETSGGVRRDYLTDAVGSVVATVDQSGAVENRYRYKPYGGFLLQSGPGIEPSFGWTGETGSRKSGAGHAQQYNRARHYARETGRWTSVDPLWPEESAYGYVRGNPTTWTDPSGLRPLTEQQRVKLCRQRSKQACFECAYRVYRAPKGELAESPQRSCYLANLACGGVRLCGPCGIYPTPPPPGCMDGPSALDAYGHELRASCGGGIGNDKLAHCWSNCVAMACGGPVLGRAVCWWNEWDEDDPDDITANQIGRALGSVVGPISPGPDCLRRCADATVNLNSHA